MKQLSFFSVLLILCINIYSQSITTPNIPTQGITLEFDQIDDTISVNSLGPWDFSSFTPTSSYEMSVLPINSSVHASNYPDATHVLKSANGEFFFGYTSSQFLSYGKIGNSTTTSYSLPLVLINYPFSSFSTHLDSINSTVLWNGLTAPLSETIEASGVSTGSVVMPDGISYSDAVLVSTKKTTVNGPDPLFGNYLTIEEISKQFWLPGYPIPSIEILHVFSNSNLILKRTLFMKENITHSFEIFFNDDKKIIKKIDLLGRESINNNNFMFYIYEDGKVEKKIVIN